MWNMYVVSDDGECEKVNSEPYSAEQVAVFLDEMQFDVASVMLMPGFIPLELAPGQ